MTIPIGPNSQIGIALAGSLGLGEYKREGHDLAGPCVACKSSDAFRLHQQTGVAHCFSCGAKWSPFQLAEKMLGDREQAKQVMIAIGAFEPTPSANHNGAASDMPDPIGLIARQKSIPRESLIAYGAKPMTLDSIFLPAYGPEGTQCTTFRLWADGSKGMFAKGRKAGLFFPHEEGKVRLPADGEPWLLVEGPKDAAALHGLGFLACGVNTCRLAAKFVRLFAGADVILVPDRDKAGVEGAEHSAKVLRGVAASVRVASLPAEFAESNGADVRDVLRQKDGEALVRQAITDAKPAFEETPPGGERTATAEIEVPESAPITLKVIPAGKKPQRLVTAVCGEITHRDNIDTNSSVSRDRFVKKLAAKLSIGVDVLGPLVDPQMTALADQADEEGGAICDDGEPESQSTLAANMAAEWDLWHTPGSDAYATVPVGDHLETWPIKSQTFKRYVAKQFFEAEGKAINSDALSAALNLMEATALFDGEEHDIHVRVAGHEGNIYIDLCNSTWQVVEVTREGWQIIEEAPVRFRRSRGMLSFPTPEAGGSISQLRGFLNVDDTTWRLVVAWLLASLRPRGPYPLLALFAEQGSGKSTTGRLLRNLVDPNSAPLRSEHRDPRDLMIGANNSWCLAYDNLSFVPAWLSDALCRLSTGGGFATRELYTDQDEIIFDAMRPVLLTSIEEVATRSDLLDRCLIVWLPAIAEEGRRREEEIVTAFEQVQPQIFGALLDGLSGALRELPHTKLDKLPRMADFALWVTAAEKAIGWEHGDFIAAYQGNRNSANDLAIESSPVGQPLLEFVETNQGWDGSASELLNAIEQRVSEQIKRHNGWPKNGRSLAGHLKRLSPNLRLTGWEVEYHREASRRSWTIRRHDAATMQLAADPCSEVSHDAHDADDANLQLQTVGAERNDVEFEEGEL
ncbi:MAG: hypothetical protein IT424_10750 [Pirellulales bacterium]|nr:hypothetical protein [Pirellulales bacterium]